MGGAEPGIEDDVVVLIHDIAARSLNPNGKAVRTVRPGNAAFNTSSTLVEFCQAGHIQPCLSNSDITGRSTTVDTHSNHVFVSNLETIARAGSSRLAVREIEIKAHLADIAVMPIRRLNRPIKSSPIPVFKTGVGKLLGVGQICT